MKQAPTDAKPMLASGRDGLGKDRSHLVTNAIVKPVRGALAGYAGAEFVR